MAVLIEEHPLPPDCEEPPKIDLHPHDTQFSNSTSPPTVGPPTHAPES